MKSSRQRLYRSQAEPRNPPEPQSNWDDYVAEELIELRGLIQRANSDHAAERDKLWRAMADLQARGTAPRIRRSWWELAR